MRQSAALVLLVGLLMLWGGGKWAEAPQQPAKPSGVDTQVQQFLDNHRGAWRDLNVPEADGRELYRIIVAHGYKVALEIGTSTGHSGIWIAWALSKTGGKLVTIDIDRERHREALANFKAAGVEPYIDARLGDAHEIVPALQGPFDFVFSDADKEWYVNYAKSVLPKLAAGGCLVTHNVSERGWGSNFGYLQFLRGQPDLETTLFTAGGGMSISYKKPRRVLERLDLGTQ